MIDRTVARRYGEAYVDTLEATSRVEPGPSTPGSERLRAGIQELKSIAETYTGSKDLRRFLGSPEIGTQEKQELLHRIFADRVGSEAKGLLDLLLRWDRIDHLPAIWEEAASVSEDRQGILRGGVTTAHPISSAETQELAKAVGRGLGKRVVLERQLDPKLIGGIRVVVGTTVLDGSVETLLEKIRQQLMEVKVN